MNYPYVYPEQSTATEPLLNPWYTPGWTAQAPDYTVAPQSIFSVPGFPASAVFVNITANYSDNDANPIGGYLTFWPSCDITFTYNSVTTTVLQRYAGTNLWDNPGQSWGEGKMYLRNGNLLVSLLATDNVAAGMVPASFSYHVVEHMVGGKEYDIAVPSASSSPADIHSLIIPGTTYLGEELQEDSVTINFAAISTQYVSVNITAEAGGMSMNPTSDAVNFAFISGPTEPMSGDWNAGIWANDDAPYVAQILIGPSGGLVLDAGSYIIWVQVISDPQVAAFPVGKLTIY